MKKPKPATAPESGDKAETDMPTGDADAGAAGEPEETGEDEGTGDESKAGEPVPDTPPKIAAVTPVDGITIDASMKIEVTMLTLGALQRVAAEIAARVAKKASGKSVIIGSDGAIAALRAYQGFRRRLELLNTGLEDVLAAKSAAESLRVGIDTATVTVQALANLLSFFKADTRYSGRDVELNQKVLYQTLAGRLIARKVDVSLPECFPDPAANEAASLMAQLGELRELCTRVSAQVPEDSRSASLIAAVDAAFDEVDKPAASSETESLLDRLLLGAELHATLGGTNKPLFLSAAVLTAGGSYRTKKHLFTTLFWGDQLSYSGGVAVGYFLFDAADSKLVESDVLYHATGYARFPDSSEPLSGSNIPPEVPLVDDNPPAGGS